MHLKSAEIINIKSIGHFKMNFSGSGWYVVTGNNGVGKSTIIRSIALGLLGEEQAKILSSFENFSKWLAPDQLKGEITLTVSRYENIDNPVNSGENGKIAIATLKIERVNGDGSVKVQGSVIPDNALWGKNNLSGWFVAAYGPFRRLRGGSEFFAQLISSHPRLGACLTAFRDDVALTQLINWLKDLALDAPQKVKAKNTLDGVINFINHSKLLPDEVQLLPDIDSSGIKVKDANDVEVSLYDMSDGYRSVLSMTLDIIRFLIEVYGVEKVFAGPKQESISLPGVVLIDEIEAHLDPTWQTRIGNWFTQYFPAIQFIVTTHSPLICRAAEKGAIWRVAAPGSETSSGEITGENRNRLINGNILDAYGTEVFGEGVAISESSNEKLKTLAELNRKSLLGNITDSEEEERQKLKVIFPTENTLIKYSY
jgi:ABC-type cobalamin/Fe3+-siderophores transport system ATPase subunit